MTKKAAYPDTVAGVRRGRLTKPAQFEAVLSSGRQAGGYCFLVRALSNSCGCSRLGLIVGKKVAPRAVDRNRVKRLVRIVHQQLLTDLGGVDVVVQLRESPRSRANADLVAELEALLRGLLGAMGTPIVG